MNRIYRIVWSHACNAWVVVSDLAKRRTKSGSSSGRRGVVTTSTALATSMLLSSLLAGPAAGDDLYWDPNGSTAGRGGTGDWDATSSFWTTNPNGTGGPFNLWTNGNHRAIFGGTGGTVTLTRPSLTLEDITFEVGHTLTGGTITLDGTAPSIGYLNSTGNSIASVLAGNDGVIFTGNSTAGWLYVSGANTLTGGITIDTGARVIANGGNNVFNGANNVVTINGGAGLRIENSNAFGGNTEASRLVMHDGAELNLWEHDLTHDITATGGTITIQNQFHYWRYNRAATWNGSLVLTGDTTLQALHNEDGTFFAGNLTDTGPYRLSLFQRNGAVYLDGNNTFTGGIRVGDGTLVLRDTGAAGGAGNVVNIESNGILQVERTDAFRDTAASSLIVNNGGWLRVNTASLTHDITLTGGSARLDGVGGNTWNGTAVLTADTLLRFGGVPSHQILTGNLSDNGAVLSVTLDSGDTWIRGGTHSYSGDTRITAGAELVLDSATTLSPNTTVIFEGTPTGSDGLISLTTLQPTFTLPVGTGDGQIWWNGSGGFYARDSRSDATVNLFGDRRTLTWAAGGFVPNNQVLILGTNTTNANARSLDFQNGIDLNGAVRTVRADNGNATDHAIISGVLSGTGGLQLMGTGLLELSGANTFSGPTIVGDGATNNQGVMVFGSADWSSPSSNLQLNGVTTAATDENSGFVILTAASGDFTMPVGIGGGQVQWTGSGGFGAFGGERTVNMGGAGATLTWGAGGFVQDGDVLRFHNAYSDSVINLANGLELGAVERIIHTQDRVGGAGVDLRLNGVIQGTGALRLTGGGDVDLNAANTFTGALIIGNGLGGGSDDSLFVRVNTLADAGVASPLGAGSTVQLSTHTGGLAYVGSTNVSTNRALVLSDANGTYSQLRNDGTGSLTWTGSIAANSGAAVLNELALAGTHSTPDGNGDGIADNPDVISGVISNGLGTVRVATYDHTWRLSGANTYTGRTLVNLGSVLEVTDLQNGGLASNIGASTRDAGNLFVQGTLRYIGDGDSTDRLMTLWNNSVIESSGTGALAFTNAGELVRGGGNSTYSVHLGGTNTGENTFAPTLTNLAAAAPTTNSLFLAKDGPGQWALVTDSNAHANAYTSNTRITGGALRLDQAGAVTGGLGVASSHGAAGSVERSSMVVFEGQVATAGVLGLTNASGGFSRGTTTAGSSWVGNNGTADLNDDRFVQGVRWTGSGGFAAWGGTQVVNLFNDQRGVTWNAGGFVPTNHSLVFGYQTASGTIDFQNPINLVNTARTVDVRDGLAGVDAILSGALSSTTTAGGLIKSGTGTLVLTGANTYTGNTTVAGGVLQLGNGGTTGNAGTGAQVTLASGTTLIANRSDALTLNAVTDGVGGNATLRQMGAGTTTIAANSDVDHISVDAGSLVAAANLLSQDVTFGSAGGTFETRGTLQTSTGAATLVTGGALGDSFIVGAGGAATVQAALGDGNDVLDVGGALNIAGTSFALGLGDDTFTLRDSAAVAGTVDGGDGTDTFNPHVTTTATLGAAQGFETLTKTGIGLLDITGPATSVFDTVNVQEGTLDVNLGAVVDPNETTVASGTTLNVDGEYYGTTGGNTFTVAGAVTGGGTIDLLTGDDVLTLLDGANLSGLTNALDGGDQASGDTIVLDNANALSIDGSRVTGFEQLIKQNTGLATVTGTHVYTGGTVVGDGMLLISGALETPTIALEDNGTVEAAGMVQNAGATSVAITGSAGINTLRVASGGTLLASGGLDDGDDVLDVAGTLTTSGTFALGLGDDTFTLSNAGLVSGVVDGGDGNDTFNPHVTTVATLGAAENFETLTKTGAGVLNITGPAGSIFDTVNVEEGTLAVNSGTTVDPSATTVASAATLTVDGTYTGTTGDDTFTVAGIVQGIGTVTLDDGNDDLIVQNGANLDGLTNAFNGGSGTDTLTADITGTAALGGITNFEQLLKSNTGTLDLNGASDVLSVAVQGGTLNIAGTGSIADVETTTVSAGATLNVDGSFSGGFDADTFMVSGTVAGGGTIGLLDGDDVLTLNDGANLSGFTNAFDGGTQTAADAVVLNNANALSIDGSSVTGFEQLIKQNTGAATLTGAQSYVGTTIEGGTLDVDGTLETAAVALSDGTTLNVDGTVQNAGATAATITGSTGANTVRVTAGNTLIAAGDLGGGADVLDVAGTLDLGAGTFGLGDGDDTFTVHDGTVVNGTVDGGAGLDTRAYDIGGTANLGALLNFEGLSKSGTGTLNVNGPGSSTLAEVEVLGGTLGIGASGGVGGAQRTTVAAGATLAVDGTYNGTSGDDTFTVAGVVQGIGTITLGDGNDDLIVQNGANLDGLTNAFSGGSGTDTLTADITGTAALGGITNFEQLVKSNTGTLDLSGASDVLSVAVQGGTLNIGDAASIADVETTTVSAGATLNVDGSFSGGFDADTFTVSGTVAGGGIIDLLDGDDVLTLNDGANLSGLTNAFDGGTQMAADAVVLNNANALTIVLGNVTGFETLTKQSAGVATVTGTVAYSGGTRVDGGTLTIGDQLETPTIALADDTTFEADGTVQNAGATAATITGSTGANTVRVTAGNTLIAAGDLGGGADVLDVAGTLDLGAGTFGLGDGDDTFTVHDGTVVNGTVDGGAGLDTRAYDIGGTANLGALLNFEGLSKSGTGTLNVNGPGSSTLAEVEVLGGTLSIGASGGVEGAQRTTVAANATLQVDGTYTGTTGDDSFTVSGTVAGANDVALGTGDDIVTLRDGAMLNTQIDGGGQTSGDTVALDIATTFTFDGMNTTDFEVLAKQNGGTATLTGAQSYAGTRIEGGTLDVDGTLETATVALSDGTTLNVDGTVQNTSTAAAITGSTGSNTLRVMAGAMLLGSGDLGEGADILDVSGTLDTGSGAIDLGAGDDTFLIHDGTNVIGTVVGGAGNDTRVYDLTGTADIGAMQQFESLTKRNTGTLNLNGPATSALLELSVEGGTLNVSATAGVTGLQAAGVASGATLNVDGSFVFTAGTDSFSVAGTVSGLGAIDLLDGDDELTVHDGADMSGLATALEGGAGTDTLTAAIATTARLGGATGFETLIKEGSGALTIAGPAGSMFDTVRVQAGLLEVVAGAVVDPQTTAVESGATLKVDGTYYGTSGADTFTLSGTLAGTGMIDLLDGDDALTINTGAGRSYTGRFDAAGGTDRLVLGGAGSDSFELSQIGTVLQNFETYRKEGTGTWRLIGAADHDWSVADGTLIGDTASFGGNIDNAGTVVFDQAVDGTYDGVLSGSGTLIKEQSGTLVFASDQPFNGTTRINGGTLQIDAALPSTITVAAGGTLSGIGRVSSVTNLAGGIVAPGNAATPFGTLTIAGDYTGGGTVSINTVLGNEDSETSRLVIQGNTSGRSAVLINRAGGEGVRTHDDGIEVIQVDGASAADSFRLAQAVQAGAYEYFLHQGGTEDPNDWYLRSQYVGPGPEPVDPVFRPGVAGYVLGHQASLEYGYTALGDLRSRVGSQGRALDAASSGQSDSWMRVHASELDVSGERFEARDLRTSQLHFGSDVYRSESGATHLGAMVSVGEGSTSFFDPERANAGLSGTAGEMELDVKGVGVYWTQYGASSGYLDLSAQLLHYRNRYRDQFLASSSQRGWGTTVSAELGAAYALWHTGWKIEPQLQLGYQRLVLDEFEDNVSTVSAVDDDALRAHAGVRLFRAPGDWLGMSNASPYLALGAQHDMRTADAISIGGTPLSDTLPATTVDASIGVTGTLGAGFELNFEMQYQQATAGERDGVRANLGLRKVF